MRSVGSEGGEVEKTGQVLSSKHPRQIKLAGGERVGWIILGLGGF